MTLNPINLAVRFLCEVVMWLAIGVAASTLADGVWGVGLGIGAMLLAMALWAVPTVPGDRSRNQEAVMVVPGGLRLLIEVGLFAVGVAALVLLGQSAAAGVFAVVLTVHYVISYDRVLWLLNADAFPAFITEEAS